MEIFLIIDGSRWIVRIDFDESKKKFRHLANNSKIRSNHLTIRRKIRFANNRNNQEILFDISTTPFSLEISSIDPKYYTIIIRFVYHKH